VIDGELLLKHAPAAKKSDINYIKNVKIYIGIADQQRQGNKVGMIAYNISVYNPTLHIFNSGKTCRVELCTELVMLSSLPCFPAFC